MAPSFRRMHDRNMATAKKSARKRALISDVTPKVQAKLQIRLDPSTDTPSVYANYFEVAHNAHDVSIFAAKLPAKLSAAQVEEVQRTSTLVAEPEIQLVLAPTLVPALIEALQSQHGKWQSTFGNLRTGE